MDPVYNTLTKTWLLMDSIRKPYPAEVSIIISMFVSPERIEAFGDHELYLSFIQTLLENRENVSFPDTGELLDRYFNDCVSLMHQMGISDTDKSVLRDSKETPHLKDDWLSCCIRLLENLKTPYYPVYSEVLVHLRLSFPDTSLFERTLQAFYSVIIKSTEETLTLIRIIASFGAQCFQQDLLSKELLSDLLILCLSVFADGKNIWADRLSLLMQAGDQKAPAALLQTWLNAQYRFMEATPAAGNLSQAEWLSASTQWLRNHPEIYSEYNSLSADYPGKVHPVGLRLTSDSRESAASSTFLNTYAYNMNERTYKANPAIGREQELKDLELILISPKKSPILIGESGVGKTSVVEGLVWCLQRGEVPDLLKNRTIFKLTTTSLLSGTKYVGEMEERIRQLTAELYKYPDVILFIDEIHTIVGAGSTESSHNDISNMLKPFIDRGDIKIIGATTVQEYESFLLPDRALARRFYPIEIEEPDTPMTLDILLGTIPVIEADTRVKNIFSPEQTHNLLSTLIRLSDTGNQPEGRVTRLPELPLTILEMAFSYAALDSRTELSVSDLIQAVRHTNLLKKEVKIRAAEYFSD